MSGLGFLASASVSLRSWVRVSFFAPADAGARGRWCKVHVWLEAKSDFRGAGPSGPPASSGSCFHCPGRNQRVRSLGPGCLRVCPRSLYEQCSPKTETSGAGARGSQVDPGASCPGNTARGGGHLLDIREALGSHRVRHLPGLDTRRALEGPRGRPSVGMGWLERVCRASQIVAEPPATLVYPRVIIHAAKDC